MKILIDNALSPQIAIHLREEGYDAIHVREINMASASDAEIFEHAIREKQIIVSADTDFGALLVLRNSSKPSFILFRQSGKRPDSQLTLLRQYLPKLQADLVSGCIAVFEDERIRIRSLPVGEEE